MLECRTSREDLLCARETGYISVSDITDRNFLRSVFLVARHAVPALAVGSILYVEVLLPLSSKCDNCTPADVCGCRLRTYPVPVVGGMVPSGPMSLKAERFRAR